MKLFSVTFERDGDTRKEPGRTETDVLRETYYFVANDIENVIYKARTIANEPFSIGKALTGINEVLPFVEILNVGSGE